MTHIHSNWKTEYTAMENTTDCYAGCTGITHCDGVDLGVNEYIVGLDEVPTAWGGFGFSKDVTSIVVVNIPSDNYVLTVCDNGLGAVVSQGNINWGDGTVGNITSDQTHTYATAGTYTIKGHFTFGYWGCTMTKELIEVKQVALNARNKIFKYAFNGCKNLTKVTAYNLTPTDCGAMFKSCSSLTEIVGMDTWNMSNCTSVSGMFSGCSSLTEIVGLDTWNMSNCSDISGMFSGCSSLPNDKFQAVSAWNIPKVTTIKNMFTNAKLLTSIDISNFTSLSKMELTFNGCSKLEYVKLGGNINDATQAFRYCSSLTRIDNFNVNNSLNAHYLFHGCDKLSNIEWKGVLSYGERGNNLFMIDGCPLSVDTMVGLFNILATVTETQTLTLGKTNLAKLTDEQIAIATNKGWTVS